MSEFGKLSKAVSSVTLNPTFRWVFILVLILYVFSIDQVVTADVNRVLRSTVAKLVVLALVVLLADRDPLMAILLAVAYLVSLNGGRFFEGLEGKDDKKKTNSDDPSKATEEEGQKIFIKYKEKSKTDPNLKNVKLNLQNINAVLMLQKQN